MLTDNEIENKWNQIKDGIRTLWGNLSEEQLDATKGNLASIAGVIQNQYGETKEAIQEKIQRLLDSFDNETDRRNFYTDSYQRKPDGLESRP